MKTVTEILDDQDRERQERELQQPADADPRAAMAAAKRLRSVQRQLLQATEGLDGKRLGGTGPALAVKTRREGGSEDKPAVVVRVAGRLVARAWVESRDGSLVICSQTGYPRLGLASALDVPSHRRSVPEEDMSAWSEQFAAGLAEAAALVVDESKKA